MSGKEKITEQEVPMRLFALSKSAGKPSVDMNQVVGKCDILMICLDTLPMTWHIRRSRQEILLC